MSTQDDSDPLPYLQLDRAAKPVASRLAGRYEVSFQHALGTLAEFWEINGEPRALMALLEQNVEQVILTRDEVIRRFRIASAIKEDIDPADLVTIGILATDDSANEQRWRVRGMSRYFDPLKRRMTKNAAASEGGKKSAEARREKNGTATPTNASNETKSTKKKKPQQGELPEMPPKPPRERSMQEQAFFDYQVWRRRVICEENNQEFVKDQPTDKDGNSKADEYAIAFINNALAPLLKDVAPLADGETSGFERVMSLWFDDKWAASRTPAFPFQAFVAEKIYKGLIAKLTGVPAT